MDTHNNNTASGEASIWDTVGKNIQRLRDIQQKSQVNVVDDLHALGVTMLKTTLSKVENGDRKVSILELFGFAAVLNVAPVLLLFPLGRSPGLELLPGQVFPAWDALRWFTGEAAQPIRESSGQWLVPYVVDDPANAALDLHRHHDKVLNDVDATDSPIHRAETLRELVQCRRELRRHGLLPPTLPAHLGRLDTLPSLPVAQQGGNCPGELDRERQLALQELTP